MRTAFAGIASSEGAEASLRPKSANAVRAESDDVSGGLTEDPSTRTAAILSGGVKRVRCENE